MHAVKDDQDLNQMGGDFVIDAAGVIRLAHYSATNTDRPVDAAKKACVPGDHTRTDDRCNQWAEAEIIAASHDCVFDAYAANVYCGCATPTGLATGLAAAVVTYNID